MVSSVIGYHQYKATIEKQYNTTAYQCANVALSYVGEEKLKEYAEATNAFRRGELGKEELDKLAAEDEYKQTKEKIEALRENMGANDVFLFVLDTNELMSYSGTKENWNPICYIFDSYTVPEYSYTLGDIGSFNPDYIEELNTIAVTGNRSDNYFFSKGDYGYNTAAIEPILDESGRTFAMAAVEIPMVTLQMALRQYLIYAVLVTVGIIVLFMLIYMVYLYYFVVRPIDLIAKGTDNFVKNNNHMPEQLLKIKTHDEIQTLL